MTREITHMKAFAAALESMKKPAFSVGKIAPTPGLVNQFFNDSTGVGDEGEIDTRGPWNEGGDWEFVESPAMQQAGAETSAAIKTESSPPTAPGGMDELLIDELRDILHAEKQLTKRCQKWRRRPDMTGSVNCSSNISSKRSNRSSVSMSVSRCWA